MRRARISKHVPIFRKYRNTYIQEYKSQHWMKRLYILVGGCPPKPLGSQVKREVNQANGMARCHQNHTLVDLAYLLRRHVKINQQNNNTFIG